MHVNVCFFFFSCKFEKYKLDWLIRFWPYVLISDTCTYGNLKKSKGQGHELQGHAFVQIGRYNFCPYEYFKYIYRIIFYIQYLNLKFSFMHTTILTSFKNCDMLTWWMRVLGDRTDVLNSSVKDLAVIEKLTIWHSFIIIY